MNNFSNQASWNTPPPSPHDKPQGEPSNNNNNTTTTASNSDSGSGNNNINKRRTGANLALDTKLRQMALPLAPLVQLTSGQVHPAFPATLLGFWLLTDAQLDEMAHFYHQRTPCQWTRHYPCPITWAEGLSVEEKRRKMGKFIGLRGVSFSSSLFLFLVVLRRMWNVLTGSQCETPMLMKTREQIEAEARRHRVKEAEEEMFRRKTQWY